MKEGDGDRTGRLPSTLPFFFFYVPLCYFPWKEKHDQKDTRFDCTRAHASAERPGREIPIDMLTSLAVRLLCSLCIKMKGHNTTIQGSYQKYGHLRRPWKGFGGR